MRFIVPIMLECKLSIHAETEEEAKRKAMDKFNEMVHVTHEINESVTVGKPTTPQTFKGGK